MVQQRAAAADAAAAAAAAAGAPAPPPPPPRALFTGSRGAGDALFHGEWDEAAGPGGVLCPRPWGGATSAADPAHPPLLLGGYFPAYSRSPPPGCAAGYVQRSIGVHRASVGALLLASGPGGGCRVRVSGRARGDMAGGVRAALVDALAGAMAAACEAGGGGGAGSGADAAAAAERFVRDMEARGHYQTEVWG